ncbi:MAG: hypothetical protein GQ527_04780 [Bacteroidales bacterium]|nr:hypothetical protein [Bacteroidales bacterium]
MELGKSDLLFKIRSILVKDGVKHINLASVSKILDIPIEELKKSFEDDYSMVSSLLKVERQGFRKIFDEYDFEGVNAIDILMTVSRELAQKYEYITPAYSTDLKEYFPDIYEEHFNARRDFIFEKIQINLYKGISQGWYRSDLSIELIARLYMSRLMDIHNTDYFPPEKFSFEMIFELMFDSLVRSIATNEGLEYFKKKKTTFKFH